MAQVVALLVATSTGRTLADELATKGLYTNLLDGADGVPKVLLGLNGQPVLNHWMAAIRGCSRLSPIEEKVFILCNENNADAVRTWASDPRLSAGGFPADNILTNGSDDSLGLAADVAFFLANAPPAVARASSLVLIEADALCGPNFGLSRVVEHGVVRGKDTICYMTAPEGFGLEGSAVVGLEDTAAAPDTVSQRVTGIDAQPGGVSDIMTFTAVLAPVAVLRSETLERVQAASAASANPAGGLGELLAALRPGDVANPPFYAMAVDCFVRLNDAYNLQLASNFYAFYNNEKSGVKGEAAKALEAARRLAALQEARTAAGGSLAGAVKLMNAAEAARPREPTVDAELRRIYRDFWGGWMRGDRHYDVAATAGRGGVTPAGMPGAARAHGTATLPLRFADVTTRRHNPKGQHAVYQTSNNVYGQKMPTQLDMPMAYASSGMAFTNSFPVNAPKSTGLVTAVTKSKVHKALDDY
ncbi:hypothetical protein HYH03_009941 [Edaphochlamys debaryana]|uniref:Uncharacterized protein n=1 Tax=Edaphochlamys debaryana TaxID=47281 RepID=A0A835Y0E4_9CHLO|nr:hypothetical protein HYH03_009941 [Edaphochlamys debaryana]|eukprot:KAG2491781.1 hypothetical protein HYH03_009941 [Edaphochlamys debaryana]